MRPAPITSSTASAISATTRSVLPRRRPSPPLCPRPPSCSTLARSMRDTCATGMSPNSTPVATESSSVNPSTDGSTASSESLGTVVGARATRIRTPGPGEQQPERTARHTEDQALGERQLEHVALARAKRRAHRDLAALSIGPGQHQVGDIGAGEQQQQSHRRGEHHQRELHLAAHLVGERHRERREVHCLGIFGEVFLGGPARESAP